jgi:leader peptidase (prepilin peptidase)/N-methyltransferase
MGLLFGSFFNVLIWRIPRNENIAFPASHCPQCNRAIKPWENIPVISYIILKGKCAGCKTIISITYPLIEIITGICFLLAWFILSPQLTTSYKDIIPFVIKFSFLVLMIPVAVIDIKHYIIPDSISLSLLVIALSASFLPGDITPLQSLTGIAIGGGVLYGIGVLGKILFKKDAMGFGDVKLMAAAGALWGAQISAMGIIFGSFLGSLTGIPLLLIKKLGKEHAIPFGPYLGAGLWLAVFAGYDILNAYLNLIDYILFVRK